MEKNLTAQMSASDRQLIELATKAARRWGVECPQEPSDPKRAATLCLKQCIAVACKTPFVTIYPNDHSWSSTGLRPLTIERLKHDERDTLLEKSGEEWGVFAFVEGFGNSVVIPIAADLSEETADAVAQIVEAEKSAFVNLDELPSLFARFSDGTPIEEGEIEVSIACALWENIRDISNLSNLPLSEAVFFRKPVAWDLVRARISGAGCPEFPSFSAEEFQNRKNRSIRFNRNWADSTKKILEKAALKTVDLNTPEGRNWFAMVVTSLNSLGIGKPFEGLSVLLHFNVIDRLNGQSGVRNLCIAYGLDPLQASYLLELASEDPSYFHDLDLVEDKIFQCVGVNVIPDMHLSAFNATSVGRDSEAYDRIFQASKKEKAFLNA